MPLKEVVTVFLMLMVCICPLLLRAMGLYKLQLGVVLMVQHCLLATARLDRLSSLLSSAA